MMEQLQAYLNQQLPARNELFQEMEREAMENQIPIMSPHSLETMLQIIRIQAPQRILEIGTAIGYSALRMAEVCPNTKIVTVERDENRAQVAKQYIKRAGTQTQITLVLGDALEVADQIQKHGNFDVIFIDAAKGQYRRFFELYEPLLNESGLIITDNVLFKGLVYSGETVKTKRFSSMVKKIRAYNEWILQHPDYDTVIVPVGDGVAISRKRGEENDEEA